jgi:hypothetical protein
LGQLAQLSYRELAANGSHPGHRATSGTELVHPDPSVSVVCYVAPVSRLGRGC